MPVMAWQLPAGHLEGYEVHRKSQVTHPTYRVLVLATTAAVQQLQQYQKMLMIRLTGETTVEQPGNLSSAHTLDAATEPSVAAETPTSSPTEYCLKGFLPVFC